MYTINNLLNLDLSKMKVDELESLMGTITGNADIEKSHKCPSCDMIYNKGNIIEDYAKGIIICKCGQVLDEIFDTGIFNKQFDKDDDTPSGGMMYNKLLPHSSLGTIITKKGKLQQLHIWNSMPYKDRSLISLFKQVHIVCLKNGIKKKIEDDTKIICHRVNRMFHKDGKNKDKPIITRGDNRKGIIAATLFMSS